jgi:hypothetical protein
VRLGDDDDRPERAGPEDRETDSAFDLAALRADDAFVDQLAAGRVAPRDLPPSAKGTEDELVAMLAAWVAEVRPETLAPPADQPNAAEAADSPTEVAAEPTPLRAARGRHRAALTSPYARRLAVAAALVVLSTSGLAVGAASAEPGEVLWPVSKVFYAERARSVEAAVEVNEQLAQARVALREGRRTEAAKAIEEAMRSALWDEPARPFLAAARAVFDRLADPLDVELDAEGLNFRSLATLHAFYRELTGAAPPA